MSEQDDDDGGKNNVVRVDFAARRAKPVPAPTPTQPPAASHLGAERPEKLRMFARLIEKGMVMVTIDSRVDNTRLPPRFAGELQLNLNFSHRFGLADFDYDDEGLRASLSFGGTPFFCDIPWTAIYGMSSSVNGERMLWPDSFPRELVALLPAQARHIPSAPAPADSTDPPDPPPAPRPTLRRVK